MNAVTVQDVTRTDFTTVPEAMSIDRAGEMFRTSLWVCFPVVDCEGRMNGIISLDDIRMIVLDDELARRVVVGDIMTRDVITVFSQDTLARTMEQFGRENIDHMPVVNRKDPRRVEGMIKRQDVLRSYNRD
jgi:CIC family chloride channel protein